MKPQRPIFGPELTLATATEKLTRPTEAWLSALVRELCRERLRPVPGLGVLQSIASELGVRVMLEGDVAHVEKAGTWLYLVMCRLSRQQLATAADWALKHTERQIPATPAYRLIEVELPGCAQRFAAPLEAWLGGIVSALPTAQRAPVFNAARDVRFEWSTPGHHRIHLEMPERFGGPRAAN